MRILLITSVANFTRFPLAIALAGICTLLQPGPAAAQVRVAGQVRPVVLPQDEFVSSIRENAQLNDLAVVSESRIVAVGNCGLIAYSENGGRNWVNARSPSTDNLHSVDMTPSGVGVCVGGRNGAHTRDSRATVLRTTDGGSSWEVVPVPGLPRLVGVKVSGGVFMAWGDLSSTFGTGVFRSTDGGLNWQALKLPIGHVIAAGGIEVGGFAAVDRLGQAVLRLGQTSGVPISDFARPLRAIHHTGSAWIAAGASGELITSVNGKDWRSIPLPLSEDARRCVDFDFISQVAQEIWVGGTPGSFLMHSRDLGQTWKKVPTDQAAPIKSVGFYDHDRGWAICGVGRILATRDGGKSWYVQRDAADRLGVLAVSRSAMGQTWVPTVSASWEQQCTSGMLVLGPFDPVEYADSTPSPVETSKAIASQIGVSEYHELSADEQWLEDKLAIRILSQRPDVVLVDDSRDSGDAQFHHGLREASDLAAAAVRFASKAGQQRIATELNLAPWQVKKLAAVSREGAHHYSESPQRVLSSAGLAVRDVMAALPTDCCNLDETVYLRTLWSSSQAASATKSLLGAIPPSKQTGLQRPIIELGNYQLIMGRVHRESILERVVEEAQKYASNGSGTAETDELWRRQLGAVLRGMPVYEFDRSVIKLISQLEDPRLEHYRRLALREIMAHGKGRDIATYAKWQLLSRADSDERAAWKNSLRDRDLVSKAAVQTAQATRSADATSVWNASPFGETSPGSGGVQTVGHVDRPVTAAQPAQPWQALMASVPDVGSSLSRWPQFNLMFSARKRAANHEGGSNLLSELALQKGFIGLPQAAAQEVLLRSPGRRPRWQVDAGRADQPPVLDGNLDEPCWSMAGVMELQSSDTRRKDASGTQVRWAFDQEYLYLALDCPVSPAATMKPVVPRSEYDSQLGEVDRVELLIDTDRDYSVGVHIAVAEDGRTFDRCGGNAAYNPKWYVAVAQEADRWSAEIAMPLSELTTVSPQDLDAWAVTARRVGPSRSAETWALLHTNRLSLRSAGIVSFRP